LYESFLIAALLPWLWKVNNEYIVIIRVSNPGNKKKTSHVANNRNKVQIIEIL
jgi:hypothetical protein